MASSKTIFFSLIKLIFFGFSGFFVYFRHRLGVQNVSGMCARHIALLATFAAVPRGAARGMVPQCTFGTGLHVSDGPWALQSQSW